MTEDKCGSVCRVRSIGIFYVCELPKGHDGDCNETVTWNDKDGNVSTH